MKIIEAQSAMLTNYEVYKHLSDQKQRHDALILDNVYAEGDRESVEISRKKNMKTRPPNFLAVTKGVGRCIMLTRIEAVTNKLPGPRVLRRSSLAIEHGKGKQANTIQR